MSDGTQFGDDLLQTAEDSASDEYDRQINAGASIEDALKNALETGATAAAAAGCAATGVGAIAAPICGWLGGKIAPALEKAGKDIAQSFESLFGPDKPQPWQTTPCGDSYDPGDFLKMKDAIFACTPERIAANKRIDVYLAQAVRVDYLAATMYLRVNTAIGRALQDLDQIPDPMKIEHALAERLPLVWLNPVGGDTSGDLYWWLIPEEFRDKNHPNDVSLAWHAAYRPPSMQEKFKVLLSEQASGVLSLPSVEAFMKTLLADQEKWIKQLQVEAGRILLRVAVRSSVSDALSTQRGRTAPKPGEISSAHVAAIQATLDRMKKGIYPPNYLTRRGIVAGVQFIKV